MANNASDIAINFDLLGDPVVDTDRNLLDKLTKDEKEVICWVVDQLEHVNSCEIFDFTDSQDALVDPHHKIVSNDKLDYLAGNNSSENTQNQTKWAVTVIKGTY